MGGLESAGRDRRGPVVANRLQMLGMRVDETVARELMGRFSDRRRLTVALSGSSGLVGATLETYLKQAGHDVRRLVRTRPTDYRDIYWNHREGEIDAERLAAVDAVVHLAGEPIVGERWTAAKKERIRESRVAGTQLLAETLAGLEQRPGTLICASAIGYYGTRGAETLTEASAPGEGFLPEVCAAWEAATQPATVAGVRVVNLRIGIVLSPRGGALQEMLTPFRLGVGGVVGSGKQYMSWIALTDLIGLIDFLLHREEVAGAVNATGPEPVTNRQFTKALGRALGRPTVLPVPGFAIKLAFGEMGDKLLLHGQRVLPARAQEAGYGFVYRDVASALRAELAQGA